MSMIVTLTGMSTSGKSTFAKMLSSTECYSEAVSVTTRKMRPGEVDGKDYYFVTQEQFDALVDEGKLLEHVRSHHACYGVPASEVDRIKSEGKSAVIVLEPEGVASIHKLAMEKSENFLSVFVSVDPEILGNRFIDRILKQIESGKPFDPEAEARRLHVMISQELDWHSRWNWDIKLNNLHMDDKLSIERIVFCNYHKQSSLFSPMPASLKESVSRDCLNIEELIHPIKKAVEGKINSEMFSKKVGLSKIKGYALRDLSPQL